MAIPKAEIEQARNEWLIALEQAKMADPDFIDAAILKANAAMERYSRLVARAKAEGLERPPEPAELSFKARIYNLILRVLTSPGPMPMRWR